MDRVVRVLIRADASVGIGTGHVMRCLTLAEALRARGHAAGFVCRPAPGDAVAAIRARGFDCAGLAAAAEAEDAAETAALARATGADRVIVDHYGLGASWEAAMPVPVMAIDDLRRAHVCDLLLDQTLGATPADYADRVPAGARLLLGAGHALLRPDFAARRAAALAARRGRPPRRVLVAMGGTDPGNATGWALRALAADLPPDAAVTVVLGAAAPHLDAVRAVLPDLPCAADLVVGTDRMADLMADADLAVGASGATAWERCCLGLPTVAVVIADNQERVARRLDAAGAALRVGLGDDAALRAAVARLRDPGASATMQDRAAAVCDGRGVGRVMAALSEAPPPRAGMPVLRPATRADADLVRRLRLALSGGRGLASGGEDAVAHAAWMAHAVADPTRLFLIPEVEGRAIGYVRVDPDGTRGWRASLCLDAAARGRGWGAAVLETACRRAEGMDFVPIHADIHPDNTASLHTFRRCGFAEACAPDAPPGYLRLTRRAPDVGPTNEDRP